MISLHYIMYAIQRYAGHILHSIMILLHYILHCIMISLHYIMYAIQVICGALLSSHLIRAISHEHAHR